MNTPAVQFGVAFVAFFIAHQVADHWVQTDHQATHKGDRGWAGRRACAAHVATYTACTTIAVVVLGVALGLGLSPAGVVVGQVVSAATHYIADRRAPLARLAHLAGKDVFWQLGIPRAGRDDLPTLGTGRYALDQSWHVLWLGVAALLTAVI